MTRLRSEVGHSVADPFVHPRREALNIGAPTAVSAATSRDRSAHGG